ncbi:MAG: hypothetical protein HS126_31715 [Anaerolineales bacterium]|nr:hypothetical protein [Anaerolineales bacterium]
MAKPSQAVKTQPDKKSQPKAEPAAVAEGKGLPVNPDVLPGRLCGAASDGSIQAQSARLGDARLQGAQRQALALHIGRM